jgi:hypothetical protein
MPMTLTIVAQNLAHRKGQRELRGRARETAGR